jgi:hypothetical protein
MFRCGLLKGHCSVTLTVPGLATCEGRWDGAMEMQTRREPGRVASLRDTLALTVAGAALLSSRIGVGRTSPHTTTKMVQRKNCSDQTKNCFRKMNTCSNQINKMFRTGGIVPVTK